MMNVLVWVLALLLVGLAVMVAEVFLPSGGVLGFLSVVAIGAAIVTAFLEGGAAFGFAVLAMAFVAVPVVLALAFRWFPDTPLGRRVLPPPPEPDEVLPDAAVRRRLRECIGRTGRVTSELVPWGRVEIDDFVCDALAEAGPIAAGEVVEVTAVQGGALIVRLRQPVSPAAAEPTAESARESTAESAVESAVESAAESTAQAAAGPDPGPALSPTLETFDFETLEH